MNAIMTKQTPATVLKAIWRQRSDGYNVDGEAFRRFVEEQEITEFNEYTLKGFKAWLMDQGYAAATVNRRLSGIRTRMKALVQSADLPGSQEKAIMESLYSVKMVRRSVHVDQGKVIKPSEMENLRAEVTDEKALVLVEFLWQTGLRISEALSVRNTESHLHRPGRGAGHFEVRVMGKGSSERTVFASAELVNRIRRVYGSREWLFQSQKKPEAHMRRTSAYDVVSYWIALVLGRRLGPHSFRHSFVFRKLEEGQPLPAVSRYAGHSDVSTTAKWYSANVLSPDQALS